MNDATERFFYVKLDPGKGSCQKPGKDAEAGKPLGALPPAVRRGYRFTGWTFADGTPATPDTVPDFSSGAPVLYAKYEKDKSSGTGSFHRQRRAAAILAAALCLIAVAVILVYRYLVDTYPYADPADGTVYTVRRVWDPVEEEYLFALTRQSGERLPTVEYSTASTDYVFYETDAGTWVEVNGTSGKAKTYAVVDVDGEEQVGFGDRVLLYPAISQEQIFSITVTNEYGTFTTRRDAEGNVHFVGAEDVVAYPNPELYASLCSTCGYTLSADRVENPIRDADGSFCSEYGLDGSRKFTVTRADISSSGIYSEGKESYTVYIGDALVSGGGFYAQLEGRDKVYIFSIAGKSNAFYHTLDEVLLVPVEALVLPAVTYPMDANSYYDIVNFVASEYGDGFAAGDEEDYTLKIAFSFVPLWLRTGTLDSTVSYRSDLGIISGFRLDGDNVAEVVQNLYAVAPERCVKLNPEESDLAAHGLLAPRYMIHFGMWIDVTSYLPLSAFDLSGATRSYRASGTSSQNVQTNSGSVRFDTVTLSEVWDTKAEEDGETYTYRITTTGYSFLYGGSFLYGDALEAELNSTAYKTGSGGYDSRYDAVSRLYYTRIEDRVYVSVGDQQSYAAYNKTASKVERLLENDVFVSDKNEAGNFYVYNMICGQITEVSSKYFGFLEWDAVTWVNSQFFVTPLAYVTDFEMTAGDYHAAIRFDNSLSDQSEGFDSTDIAMLATDSEGHRIDTQARFRFYTKEYVGGKEITALWLVNETDYSVYNAETGATLRYSGAAEYTSVNSFGVTCKNIPGTLVCTDGSRAWVDADYVHVEKDGVTTDYPRYAVKNLRQFFIALMRASLEGEADLGEADPALAEEIRRAIDEGDDSGCQLVMTIRVEDNAKASGTGKENNLETYTFRFWQYTKGKSYITVETRDRDGNLTSTPDRDAIYHFYVKASFAEKLANDVRRVLSGEPVDASGKT